MEEMNKTTSGTKKTATKKSAGRKKTTDVNVESTESVAVENEKLVKEEVKKVAKKYAPEDIIQCHSIFPGTFLFSGPKTKIVYTFEAKGDICYVEYQDLLAAMLAKKKSIMSPYIIVDDEELLEDVHWQQVKKLYDKIFASKDINELIRMPFSEFKEEFMELPIGVKKQIMMEIATMVRSGEFSEMNKIKFVDEACSSNIAVLLQ